MKQLTIFLTIIASIFITGCALFTPPPPNVYAGNYWNFEKDSKAMVASGTQGTQQVAVHDKINAGSDEADTDGETATPEATGADGKNAKGLGGAMFSNVAVGDRSADIDAIAALEKIEKAKNITAGQSLTATKGNESPATSGDQTQNPTQSDSKETNIPVSVGQKAESKTETEPEAGTE